MFDVTQESSLYSPEVVRDSNSNIEMAELNKSVASTVKLKERVKKSKRRRAAPEAGVIEGVVMKEEDELVQDFTVVGDQPDD